MAVTVNSGSVVYGDSREGERKGDERSYWLR